jgi:hypothetical protein
MREPKVAGCLIDRGGLAAKWWTRPIPLCIGVVDAGHMELWSEEVRTAGLVIAAGLLMVLAGLAKKQLAWRPRRQLAHTRQRWNWWRRWLGR